MCTLSSSIPLSPFSPPIAHVCHTFKLAQVLGCSGDGPALVSPARLPVSPFLSGLAPCGAAASFPQTRGTSGRRLLSGPCLVLLCPHPLPSWPQSECGIRQKGDLAGSQADRAFLRELEMLLDLSDPWTPGLKVRDNLWTLQGCHAHRLHAGMKSAVWLMQASASVAHTSCLSCLWLSTQPITKARLLPSLLLWTGTVPAMTCMLSSLSAGYEFQVVESSPSPLLKSPHLDLRPSSQSNLSPSPTKSALFASDETVTQLLYLNHKCPPQVSLFTLCPWSLSPFGFYTSKFQGFLTSASGGNHKREGQGGSLGRKSTVKYVWKMISKAKQFFPIAASLRALIFMTESCGSNCPNTKLSPPLCALRHVSFSHKVILWD